MAFRIYTKTGDKGKTSLIGGKKVPKSHLRIESYGTVDELNSFIGLLRDQLHSAILPSTALTPADQTVPTASLTPSTGSQIHSSGSPTDSTNNTSPGSTPFDAISNLLLEIQDRLFTTGASLATDPEKDSGLKLPSLKQEDIALLENEIDRMDAALPEMKSFILPGGHLAVSTAHVCRSICRRAERLCVQLQEMQEYLDPLVIQYLNRLSDYLFMLARYTGLLLHTPEIFWKPRL